MNNFGALRTQLALEESLIKYLSAEPQLIGILIDIIDEGDLDSFVDRLCEIDKIYRPELYDIFNDKELGEIV